MVDPKRPTASPDEVRSVFAALRARAESAAPHWQSTERSKESRKLAPIEREIAQEIDRAVGEWRTSAEGQAALGAFDRYDMSPVHRAFDELVTGERFARVRELVERQRRMDRETISFPIQALSIGVAGQIDFIVGLYGSFGYAADFTDPLSTSVMYFLEAVEEGAIEGADVDLQVGLWRESTDDMGGYYNGQNLDVEDIIGFAVFSLESDEELQALLIDAGLGEDDGLAEDEYLLETIGYDLPPVAQDDAAHMLVLDQLVCKNQKETGHDEVYFYFQPDGGTTYRYPVEKYYSMTEHDDEPEHTWNTGRSVLFNNSVVVTLKDDNYTLGSFTFSLGDFSGAGASKTETSTHKDGLNEVTYEMKAVLLY